MARDIPLARAAALRPFLAHMERAGVPLERHMRSAHLDGYPWDRPEAPTPLGNMFDLLDHVASRQGLEDLGFRAARDDTLAQFGETGRFVAASATPREALARVARAMPYFCPSERVVVGTAPPNDVVLVSFRGPFNPGGVHVAQQLTAMLFVGLVDAAARVEPQLLRAELARWDGARLDCLRARLGDATGFSDSGVLSLHFRPGALDQRYPTPPGGGGDALPAHWLRLKARPSVIDAIRVQIEEMLAQETPSVGDVAAAAGVSARTLQRILAEEGASFRALLDDVRRVRALADISGGSARISEISADLGYSGQSSLSRSVRRWQARTPRDVRRAASGGARG